MMNPKTSMSLLVWLSWLLFPLTPVSAMSNPFTRKLPDMSEPCLAALSPMDVACVSLKKVILSEYVFHILKFNLSFNYKFFWADMHITVQMYCTHRRWQISVQNLWTLAWELSMILRRMFVEIVCL